MVTKEHYKTLTIMQARFKYIHLTDCDFNETTTLTLDEAEWLLSVLPMFIDKMKNVNE